MHHNGSIVSYLFTTLFYYVSHKLIVYIIAQVRDT